MFDEILNIEKDAFNTGLLQGKIAGKREGVKHGFALGTAYSYKVLVQVGFYSGEASEILKNCQDPSAIKLLNFILKECEEFPTSNREVNLEKLLIEIELKIKRVKALLHIDSRDVSVDSFAF